MTLEQIEIHRNPETLARAAADRFMRVAEAVLKAAGIFTVALSGGNTPGTPRDWRHRVGTWPQLLRPSRFLEQVRFAIVCDRVVLLDTAAPSEVAALARISYIPMRRSGEQRFWPG
jgi:hypothetical protein